MEPGHNLEWVLSVDLEAHARTIEVTVAHAEGVDVAAIAIGWGDEAIAVLPAALVILHADVETWVLGWVWCESSGDLVCLPQVHLGAACSHVPLAAVVVWVSLVWGPAL